MAEETIEDLTRELPLEAWRLTREWLYSGKATLKTGTVSQLAPSELARLCKDLREMKMPKKTKVPFAENFNLQVTQQESKK